MIYYAFFGLRPLKENEPNKSRLRLFVESAYERPDKVISRRKVPFGMLADAITLGVKI